MLDLGKVMGAAEKLAPMPTSVVQLAVVVANPSSSLRDVVNIVAYDQFLTATLLRYANSVASAAVIPIVTVGDAVLRLGLAQVLSAALGASVQGWMGEPVPAYSLAEGELWRVAMLSTLAAECLAKASSVAVPPETAAALLADIGKTVLSHCLDAETLGFLRRAETEGNQSLHQAELEMIGAHHGEVGALVAQHWGLPPGIVTGILYHHSPEASDELVGYATAVSSAVADLVAIGGPPLSRELPVLAAWMDRVGIVPADIDRLCAATSARYDELTGGGT